MTLTIGDRTASDRELEQIVREHAGRLATGLMRITGHPGGPVTRAGTNVPDFFAAITATAGVLAALRG